MSCFAPTVEDLFSRRPSAFTPMSRSWIFVVVSLHHGQVQHLAGNGELPLLSRCGPAGPELGYRVCQKRRGITSRVVERLIAKKTELKERASARSTPEMARRYRLQRDSLKWLLVCCFGYTGYKNARFGKIEAHEAINAVARETLLVAKEIAESRGYRLLHALVDSLYVWKPNATPEEYASLARAIEERTRLPLAIEAIYRYVVFLSSKRHADVPVPNRFFAVDDAGELKVRGLESRRHDTPPLVARMQLEALAILAEAHDYDGYCHKLEEAREVLNRYLGLLRDGGAAIEDLVVSKHMTREPRQYGKANMVAIAAQQLYGNGVKLRPGQTVEYVITDAHATQYPMIASAPFALWEGWHGYDGEKYARDAAGSLRTIRAAIFLVCSSNGARAPRNNVDKLNPSAIESRHCKFRRDDQPEAKQLSCSYRIANCRSPAITQFREDRYERQRKEG